MKLEKRNSETAAQPQETDKQPTGKRPVVVYIMILFIAAFLLMALSSLMTQRSHTEALGQLQNSVTAMQEVQATQERIIALQEELAGLEDQLTAAKAEQEDLKDALDNANEALDDVDRRLSAQSHLYTLMQQYSAKDYEGCSETIRIMETNGYPALLGDIRPATDVTPPSERYQELKEAVEARLAEQGQ